MSDFGVTKQIIGRKDHKCEWCGETILTGTLHQHFTGKWQGDFQNWRMHCDCFDYYSENNDDEGFYPYENERPTRG